MKLIFLAGVLDDDPIGGFNRMGIAMKERLIVVGAVLVVIVIVVAWAYLSRRSRRRAARREERHRFRGSVTKDAAKGVAEIQKYVKERQGGRRRQHRPRNPTLAETGGLPPIRSDTQPPPTPPR